MYERTIQMQMRFQGMPDEMAQQMPRSRTDHFELLFGNNQSLWQSVPETDEEANNINPAGGGNFRVMRFGGGSNDVVYYNFGTGKRIDLRELGDKNYIIEDSISKLSWKLSPDTKTILGHTAYKATANRIGTRFVMSMENGNMDRKEVADTTPIVAWFTTDIPVSAGPELGGQLPGMILELNMNNGRTVYKAVEFSPKVKTESIKEPKGGKKITQADFAKEQTKMMEQMRRNMPAGAQIRMQTTRD